MTLQMYQMQTLEYYRSKCVIVSYIPARHITIIIIIIIDGTD